MVPGRLANASPPRTSPTAAPDDARRRGSPSPLHPAGAEAMRAALAAAALAVAAEAKKQIELPKTCDEYDASHVIAFGAGCVFTLFVVARRRREQCCAEKRWYDIAARRRGAADDGTISYARRRAISYARRRGAVDENMLPRRA